MIRSWGSILSGGAGSTGSGQSALGQLSWCFHIVRGGADPGELDFRPRGVGVVVIRRVF